MENLSPQDLAKRASAAAALEHVKSGMRLGLGTGSTAAWFVSLLGERVANGLDIIGVPTSSRTKQQAKDLNIPLTTLGEIGELDLTIDGADEFDPQLRLIKGGGGALLQEKIVAAASKKMFVLTDPAKEVDFLGAFDLPVELVRFGHEVTKTKIEQGLKHFDLDGRSTKLRMSGEELFVTDEQHYILDLQLGRIGDANALGVFLNDLPGVVEHGLFINIADAIFVGYEDGTCRVIGEI